MSLRCPFQELEVDIEDVKYYVSTCSFEGPQSAKLLSNCRHGESVLLIFESRMDWIVSLRHPERIKEEEESVCSATYSLSELMDMQAAFDQDIVCCDGDLNEIGRWRKPN